MMIFYFKNIHLFKKYLVLIVILFVISAIGFGQKKFDDDIYFSPQIHKTQDWQPGYIVLKKSKDTLNGYLNIKKLTYGDSTYDIKKVWFRYNKDLKEGTLKFGGAYQEDTLRYFGFEGKRFKFINYIDESFPAKWFQTKNRLTGWVQIIEDGKITLSKGFSIAENYNGSTIVPTGGGGTMMVGGGSSRNVLPMYCIKEGDAPTVLIAAPSISFFKKKGYMEYELDEKNKQHFINCINDNFELAEKLSNKKLLFGDIEDIVKEYNQWAKNKK